MLSTPKRPDKDEYFMRMAYLVASRATCVRRQVGTVLINRYSHVIATGYNGVAAGLPHCIDKPCPGAQHTTGMGLDQCEAIHAEQNALLQCRNSNEIAVCYTTTLPCVTCIKLLLNTSCWRIVYAEDYKRADIHEQWRRSFALVGFFQDRVTQRRLDRVTLGD